jgi:Rrf2 family protein
MISLTATYALRAMACLATHPERRFTAAELSKDAGVPPGYTCKVLQALSRADLVDARRGLGGGYQLTREPGLIQIIEVIAAVDPVKRLDTCPLGIKHHAAQPCPLFGRLSELALALRQELGRSSILELVVESECHCQVIGDEGDPEVLLWT